METKNQDTQINPKRLERAIRKGLDVAQTLLVAIAGHGRWWREPSSS